MGPRARTGLCGRARRACHGGRYNLCRDFRHLTPAAGRVFRSSLPDNIYRGVGRTVVDDDDFDISSVHGGVREVIANTDERTGPSLLFV
jgi:hypothetical protein